MKITTQVTTIIRVVEDELRRHTPPTQPSTSAFETAEAEPELIELHRGLKRVQQTVEEVITPPSAPAQLLTKEADMEKIIQQATDIRNSIESLMQHPQQFYLPDQYDMPIRAAQEGRSGLEKVLHQIDEAEEPTEALSQYRIRVVDMLRSLLNLEETLEDRKANCQDNIRRCDECIAKSVELIERAENVLRHDAPPLPELERTLDEAKHTTEEMNKLLKQPEIASDLQADLNLRRNQLALLVGKLEDREMHQQHLMDATKEAYKYMDLIRNEIDQEIAKTPFTFEEAISCKENLEVS